MSSANESSRFRRELRVRIAKLRNQLWDASRQVDRVSRTLPGRELKRAAKDVSSALHAAYELWRLVEDAYPQDASILSEASPEDEVAQHRPRGARGPSE